MFKKKEKEKVHIYEYLFHPTVYQMTDVYGLPWFYGISTIVDYLKSNRL